MAEIFLYNTLSKKKELFKPIQDREVGLYTCGPTVYNYAHIGNLRSYVSWDILKRVLRYNGYKVNHVMNVTDVGHLTDDADEGEDKIEKGSKREGKSAQEITNFYLDAFKKDLSLLNIILPDELCKATDYIPEQIEMIKTLEEKGYTYKTSDGIYFDTSKVKDYNKLSHKKLEDLKEGARVEINPEKKNPTDFALWKFSPADEKRQMEWKSPWGVGFPGWHIECSAMSLKLLENELDIHCGGIDHIDVHHTNEIAQSEAATGKKFFNYWMHNAFLNIAGGKKMAKSSENFLRLQNIFIDKGLDPLIWRFALLGTSYRKPIEYSEDAVESAKNSLSNIYHRVAELIDSIGGLDNALSGEIDENYKNKFLEAINDDLNTPQALAVLQEVLRADMDPKDKLVTINDFDQVLGLKLLNGAARINTSSEALSEEVKKIINQRQEAKNNKNYNLADKLRKELEDMGLVVEDTKDGQKVYKK